ncbi:hypothetical protein PMI02_03758 [Novosphingobium sp. AP12]|nr:hypothetical protein PMI02_03758 [Novosphingobium sp. AP12]
MAEGSQLSPPPLAIWLQAAGMVLAAVGIAVSVVEFVVDLTGVALGGAA